MNQPYFYAKGFLNISMTKALLICEPTFMSKLEKEKFCGDLVKDNKSKKLAF